VLPLESVTVQTTIKPLLACKARTDTEPSALTAQPCAPIGHAHATDTVTGAPQDVDPVAETRMLPEPARAIVGFIAQTIVGGAEQGGGTVAGVQGA
jgi:hypothetical protein